MRSAPPVGGPGPPADAGGAASSPSVWALSLLRPHRTALTWLALLSLAEVLLRGLQPWTLEAVVDYALMGAPMPPRRRALLAPFPPDPAWWLGLFVAAGILVQIAHLGVLLVTGACRAAPPCSSSSPGWRGSMP